MVSPLFQTILRIRYKCQNIVKLLISFAFEIIILKTVFCEPIPSGKGCSSKIFQWRWLAHNEIYELYLEIYVRNFWSICTFSI